MPPRPLRTAPLLAACAALMSGSPVFCQEQAFGSRGWEINAFGGLMDDRPEFEPQGRAFRIGHEEVFGGRVGYLLESGLFLQAEALYGVLDLVYTPSGGGRSVVNLKSLFLTGGAGYNLSPHPRLQLFARAGAGVVRWSGASSSEVDLVIDGGGGGRYFISPSFALRLDARMHLVPSALETIREDLRPDLDTTEEELWLAEVSAGLSWFPGAR